MYRPLLHTQGEAPWVPPAVPPDWAAERAAWGFFRPAQVPQSPIHQTCCDIFLEGLKQAGVAGCGRPRGRGGCGGILGKTLTLSTFYEFYPCPRTALDPPYAKSQWLKMGELHPFQKVILSQFWRAESETHIAV